MDTHRSRRATLPVQAKPRNNPEDARRKAELALEALEDTHATLERLEALADTVAFLMGDLRFPVGDEYQRAQSRRFSRLVGLLALQCDAARLEASTSIARIVRLP